MSARGKVYYCPVEVTLNLIGGRWKPLILWHLKERGILRHGRLRRLIPTITQKMLTQQLRQLEEDGLVQRTQYAEVPPRVEYSLTGYGRELQAMLDHFCEWGAAHARKAGITITKPPAVQRPRPVTAGAERR
ncbi:MAG: winged helix-turn-helix transcriptional regulator [Longimicrobiales bacterium]